MFKLMAFPFLGHQFRRQIISIISRIGTWQCFSQGCPKIFSFGDTLIMWCLQYQCGKRLAYYCCLFWCMRKENLVCLAKGIIIFLVMIMHGIINNTSFLATQSYFVILSWFCTWLLSQIEFSEGLWLLVTLFLLDDTVTYSAVLFIYFRLNTATFILSLSFGNRDVLHSHLESSFMCVNA